MARVPCQYEIAVDDMVPQEMVDTQTNTKPKRRKKDGFYIAFIVTTLLGACLPILLSHEFTNENENIASGSTHQFLHKRNSSSSHETPKGGKQKASRVAGLDCEAWGGPRNKASAEMVYWEDIPQDSKHVSPFYKPDGPPQYFSFEMDFAGFNNVRMSMETLMGIALAMGRILVIPPAQKVHMLDSMDGNQENKFSISHFFPTEHINEEQDGFGIISMEEYLWLFREGKFIDKKGTTLFPPGNRTNWDGAEAEDMSKLNVWLRKVSTGLRWKPNRCLAAFHNSTDPKDMQKLTHDLGDLVEAGLPEEEELKANPPAVDADPRERMRHSLAQRKRLCLYGTSLQRAQRIHFPMMWDEQNGKWRMLTHFYAFLFFQDWKQDLWTKRFMRDHIRYRDEIQCAAARIVNRIRARVSKQTGGESRDFYTMHIRRGDFQDQYEATGVSSKDVYKIAKRLFPENATVYIATDEENDDYFDVLEQHYDVLYLDDFKEQLQEVNSNYMGMVEQLVASKGKVFMGCFYSTFSGYINRLRGYHADAGKFEGYENGIIESYYYAPKSVYAEMHEYFPLWEPIWAREFPASWRLIDKDIDEEDGAQTI